MVVYETVNFRRRMISEADREPMPGRERNLNTSADTL